MRHYSEDERKEGLACYDPEHRVFADLSTTKHGQELSKRDVLLILKWKLGRIKDAHSVTISDENMAKINKAVALGCERALEALTSLIEIPEIGLATATAILTVCHPDQFTILDRRVLDVLCLSPHETDGWTSRDYIDTFLPKVIECSKDWGLSLRDTDRTLWGLSMSNRIKEIIRKSGA